MYEKVIVFQRGIAVATMDDVVDAVQYVHDRIVGDASLSELSFIVSPVI